jgi:hypothetical protein
MRTETFTNKIRKTPSCFQVFTGNLHDFPTASCSNLTSKALHATASFDSHLPAQGTSHYGGTGLPARPLLEMRQATYRLPDKRRPVLLLTRNEVIDRLNEIAV